MKAVIVTDFGAEPELADLPVPEPGEGEFLVRIHAAGLNPFDWKVAGGALRDKVPHAFPFTMGSDAAGTVERVGPGVTAFHPGDRVFGQFLRLPAGLGAFAEYALAEQSGKVARIPDSLPYTLAAALPTAGTAAYQAVEAAGPEPGQTVLINGATGGVGQSAVQFAAARGARVLATATPDAADHLRGLGAAEIVDFTGKDTADQVAAAHPGGIDVLLDLVSFPGEGAARMTGLLRPGGVVVSTLGAADPEASAARGIRGVNLFHQATAELLATLAGLAATGELRVHIEAEVPLTEAPSGIARARTGQARGKTVIIV
ncbi:NADP-dependent oxidoreductase [Planomonospora venezuelensis]|uniref:NADPH:quinone reductase-like Zn-dependent oxidoreductase n=1 Tax=Planomonospora venezuelensis TaxID=1999 RepID=A0A841D9T1_PLAVE|nr:NADP-dependent oxidoreductase [Planomonospora venezuelensis]MBB5967382.1 NADPH:quinone reductase-like Zn-dependent oxidoreductase [Planomonospora venezuelensis]GIN05300.1 NADPH:quinone reductase [Planomonospora venezuelensis]